MVEVEKLCDHLEVASLQYLNETLTSSTKEIGKAALEKQKKEMSTLEKRDKHLRNELVEVEMAVKIGQNMICNY